MLKVSGGFHDWKDATRGFRKHKAHREAVQEVVTLPKTTKDIGEALSSVHKQQTELARSILLMILPSVSASGSGVARGWHQMS